MWAAFLLLPSVIALTKTISRPDSRTLHQPARVYYAGRLFATAAGIAGAGLHILHAVGKITLFFCAGAIFVALHKKISQMTVSLGKCPSR